MAQTLIVRKPVRQMQVGNTLVLTSTPSGYAGKMTKIEKIEPSRKGEWYKVNDRYIFYPGAFFETITE